jgi:hypothetical protein
VVAKLSGRMIRGAFYRWGNGAERSGGGQSSGGRWCFIKAPVMEEEARGWPFDEGKMKGWDVSLV